jgi:hypothetical protein
VLSVWEYVGSGYLNPGDVLLAAGVEASLRAAREALIWRVVCQSGVVDLARWR